jgi:hypothetical protein
MASSPTDRRPTPAPARCVSRGDLTRGTANPRGWTRYSCRCRGPAVLGRSEQHAASLFSTSGLPKSLTSPLDLGSIPYCCVAASRRVVPNPDIPWVFRRTAK